MRREQMAELKREARRERPLATAEERARIARDLHDSAGHAINVIGVRAGAARLRHHEDPDRSLVALEAIEELARQTAADIDRLVGALRRPDDRDPIAAPAGLASVPSLLAHHRGAGLDVTHRVAGMPRPLSSVVDQAAYRIMQEALTNASRHGLGSADMALDYRGTCLEITVTNPVTAPPARRGARHGLVGLRERAELLGGTLITEHNGAIHVLRARLPYETSASS
jgi:signal transduction histidine kinase